MWLGYSSLMDNSSAPEAFNGIVKLVTDNGVYAVGNLLPQPEGHSPEPLVVKAITQAEDDGLWRILAMPDVDEPPEPPEDMDPSTRAALLEDKQRYVATAQAYIENGWVAERTLLPVGDEAKYFERAVTLAQLQQEAEARAAAAKAEEAAADATESEDEDGGE